MQFASLLAYSICLVDFSRWASSWRWRPWSGRGPPAQSGPKRPFGRTIRTTSRPWSSSTSTWAPTARRPLPAAVGRGHCSAGVRRCRM